MSVQIQKIKDSIELLRQEIIHHKVYASIKTIEDLQVFMQFHVYAVWDFMSILKALQRNLTCVEVPWFPVGSADTRFLINEIVVGEESDVDAEGNRISHFELYLQAMTQSGADVDSMNDFIKTLRVSRHLKTAYAVANTPLAAQKFVDFTFDVINSDKTHLQAAIFTFGREDLIPNMFLSIVEDLNKAFPDNISIFKYYLERHIEVDGEHHSQLALQMTENLCQGNEAYWSEAEKAIKTCLERRIELWNGAYEMIQKKEVAVCV
ncbi:MAG: DUF3050 domain-containing protein [Saprospiraceae bacterium]|nr:DUF3050 domain-containing protein [Saprospiraceae bacterium]